MNSAMHQPFKCTDEFHETILKKGHKEPWNDEKAAQYSAHEIKMVWPRGHCTVCSAILYYSFTHYVAGDW
jgi:hypothetical protein